MTNFKEKTLQEKHFSDISPAKNCFRCTSLPTRDDNSRAAKLTETTHNDVHTSVKQ